MATEPEDRLLWEQVRAWRMERHHLVERAAPSDLLRVAGANVRSGPRSTWVPHKIDPREAADALRKVPRRFQSAYGPLTPDDLALWWAGAGPAGGRRMLTA